MRTDEAIELLRSIIPAKLDSFSTVGRRGDVAYLRIEGNSEPLRWAVVSSPGDRWFALDVDGGFSLNSFEEDTPDDEARRILAEYVDVAVAYLTNGGTMVKSGWLRSVILTVSAPDGSVVLRRSLARELGSIFRHSGRR